MKYNKKYAIKKLEEWKKQSGWITARFMDFKILPSNEMEIFFDGIPYDADIDNTILVDLATGKIYF